MHGVSGQVKPIPFGKANGPGQIAGSPITAAVEQAADASEGVAQRNAWRKNVGYLPERQHLQSEVEDAGQGSADQPAVIDQSAFPDLEDVNDRFALKRLVPIGNDIKRPRTGNGPEDQPRAEVDDLLRGAPRPQPAPARCPQAG